MNDLLDFDNVQVRFTPDAAEVSPLFGPPLSLMIYGPPRSRLGRLRNRIRRLLRLEEQDEIYAFSSGGEARVSLTWNAAGVVVPTAGTTRDGDDPT
jgi:hypothetical protein